MKDAAGQPARPMKSEKAGLLCQPAACHHAAVAAAPRHVADLSLSNRKTQLLHATFILESKITPDLTTKETQPETRKSPEGLRRKEKKKETKSWKDRKTKKER
jgi:hypothetical protein